VTLESPGPPKLASIQAFRAVAALLVLLYHLVNTAAFGWTTADGEPQVLGAVLSAIGPGGVDLFFVISGVVMVLTCYDRFGRPRESARFLRRRVARIYPLYWVVTAGVLAVCWVRPELATRDKFAWPALVKSLLLWPQSAYPVVAVGWTLSYEMFFYLVFAVLLLAPRRLLAPALVLWGAATVALFAMHSEPAMKATPEGHLALPLYASPLALEFIAGCFIAVLAQRKATFGARSALALGSIGLIVGGSLVGMHWPKEAHFGLVRAALFGGSSALLVYGAVAHEQLHGSGPWRPLVFLGDASYALYLTHMYVLWLLAAALPAPTGGAVDTCGRMLAGVAACIAAAALVHLAIERPLNRTFQRSPHRSPMARPQPAAAP
jgi:peptidoglycan/LPS O-acetylase OafA/YrhL